MGVKKEELGLKIRDLRKKAGLSQEKLAEAAHIDRSTLQRIENAEISTTTDTLWQILAVLNAEVNIKFPRTELEKATPELVYNVPDFLASIDTRLATLEAASKSQPSELQHLRQEVKELEAKVSSIPQELRDAWAAAGPELQTIGLLVLTLKPRYLLKLAPQNRKIFETFLKAAKGRHKLAK